MEKYYAVLVFLYLNNGYVDLQCRVSNCKIAVSMYKLGITVLCYGERQLILFCNRHFVWFGSQMLMFVFRNK